jgi:hypothetical protein
MAQVRINASPRPSARSSCNLLLVKTELLFGAKAAAAPRKRAGQRQDNFMVVDVFLDFDCVCQDRQDILKARLHRMTQCPISKPHLLQKQHHTVNLVSIEATYETQSSAVAMLMMLLVHDGMLVLGHFLKTRTHV